MQDATYSRLISWLKIILPLLALALLSTLFLVARTVDPAQTLPFADVDVEELAREQRVGKPNYSGVTDDGAAISISADHAKPDAQRDGAMTGADARAVLELENGETVHVSAGAIDLDNPAGLARLFNDVQLQTSDGYRLDTDELQISLDRTRLGSETLTRVDGPAGQITADTFALTRENPKNGNYLLVFKGNVKLIYGGEK